MRFLKVSDDFKCSYYRFVPGSTPEQATDTSTNTSQRNPVNPFSGTSVPLCMFVQTFHSGTEIGKINFNYQVDLSSLWELTEVGSPPSFLSELLALPCRTCLSCMTPSFGVVSSNLANSCWGAEQCQMSVLWFMNHFHKLIWNLIHNP